ncbi:hypothetical protein [uncultured Rhodoblastus sp.]|uniref:hypothetical protein n=1 Tax=uncultured Rhodoblastus sp. TaxID=543037 RepID=UPI0025E1BFE3|nr:hypothetical protein [uncultured Rhodoblastus sp.]
MQTARVITKSATLLDGPGGVTLRTLKRGDAVCILGRVSIWVVVEHEGVTGVLARRVVGSISSENQTGAGLEAVVETPKIPPEAKESDIATNGKKVLGPGGVEFGILYKAGLVQYGRTGLAAFFQQDPAAFPGLKPSVVAVMCAVSENEGNIEAINTYDNAFLSCGVYQWTLGADSAAGELANLLSIVKRQTPATFAELFGKYGLDVPALKTAGLSTGFISLNGKMLDNPSSKLAMRKNIWAYRFWRAAHHPDVRRAQAQLAIARIDAFYKRPIPKLNRPVSAYVTSQVGVAHLLDEHVNRPGHVPGTLSQAIVKCIASSGKPDPAAWTTADERTMIANYLALREKTNMTASADRAGRISKKVKEGQLSDERSSF